MVNSQLVAGQPVDTVFVSWSADITAKYDTYQQHVQGADVQINGVHLRESKDMPGSYLYPDTAFRVESGTTYRLDVRKNSEHAFSETTVPPRFQFSVLGVSSGDTVKYIPGASWFSEGFFTLQWFGYTGSKIFRISSFAELATPDNFIEDERTEAKIFKGDAEDRENPSLWWIGDQFARINWMYFNWTGPQRIIVSAMDENYYQYRNGILFGEQTGQNFNDVIKNGYGLFASSANDTLDIFLVE